MHEILQWCGRESRCTHQLSHSGSFLMGFPTWAQIPKLLYTFSFFYFSCIIKLLIMLFFNSKLQVEDCNVTEDLQIQPMHWSHKFITYHTPLRFLSNILLLSRRAGFWFQFYFPFFEYFCLFYMLLLKIQLLDTFPFPQLVDIQLNGLIMWMVGLSIYFWECSTLVVGLSHIPSIEHPNGRLLPKTFPHAKSKWWGLNNTGPTTAQEWHHQYFYFYFCFLICWCSFLF